MNKPSNEWVNASRRHSRSNECVNAATNRSMPLEGIERMGQCLSKRKRRPCRPDLRSCRVTKFTCAPQSFSLRLNIYLHAQISYLSTTANTVSCFARHRQMPRKLEPQAQTKTPLPILSFRSKVRTDPTRGLLASVSVQSTHESRCRANASAAPSPGQEQRWPAHGCSTPPPCSLLRLRAHA